MSEEAATSPTGESGRAEPVPEPGGGPRDCEHGERRSGDVVKRKTSIVANRNWFQSGYCSHEPTDMVVELW